MAALNELGQREKEGFEQMVWDNADCLNDPEIQRSIHTIRVRKESIDLMTDPDSLAAVLGDRLDADPDAETDSEDTEYGS